MEQLPVKNKSWLQIAQEIIPKITDEETTKIMWNETCYPFDNKTALTQFIDYLKTIKK